ncbi:HIT domain-containing protein [Candidatus Saccharibacteria bacterium]|nr:HIT domain-containing protein [Candidatus Saccharibacteria bacterium]
MQDSIFTKIIKGEIPSYKIYEDSKTYAFLDIHPDRPGHTLVVPKVQIEKFYDLSDDDFSHLMLVSKKIARHMEDVLGQRIILHIIGADVPHVHIHLVPANPKHVPSEPPQASEEELAVMAKKLQIKS